MSSQEKTQQVLQELVQQKDNSTCADCGAADPGWASCTLGVFLCLDCSGVHRTFSDQVKSLSLDFWDDHQVQAMTSSGNASARAVFEKHVPAYYYRPRAHDCSVLREQWIRAKYERKEFSGERGSRPPSYSTGFHEGTLFKKGKDKKSFLKRTFVLSQRENVLTYFTNCKDPKAVIAVRDLNACFQPEKIGHPNGLQLSFQSQGRTRNIYVYHESAEEMVVWFNAIRAARYSYLRDLHPTDSDAQVSFSPALIQLHSLASSQLLPRLTRNFLKQGFMEKTGPSRRELFRRRWFVLDAESRELLYFKDPLDAHESGVVSIGLEFRGYSARHCVPRHPRGNKWKCGLTLETPTRSFVFMCERDREQMEWLDALRQVMATPVTPEDYSEAATIPYERNDS